MLHAPFFSLAVREFIFKFNTKFSKLTYLFPQLPLDGIYCFLSLTILFSHYIKFFNKSLEIHLEAGHKSLLNK